MGAQTQHTRACGALAQAPHPAHAAQSKRGRTPSPAAQRPPLPPPTCIAWPLSPGCILNSVSMCAISILYRLRQLPSAKPDSPGSAVCRSSSGSVGAGGSNHSKHCAFKICVPEQARLGASRRTIMCVLLRGTNPHALVHVHTIAPTHPRTHACSHKHMYTYSVCHTPMHAHAHRHTHTQTHTQILTWMSMSRCMSSVACTTSCVTCLIACAARAWL